MGCPPDPGTYWPWEDQGTPGVGQRWANPTAFFGEVQGTLKLTKRYRVWGRTPASTKAQWKKPACSFLRSWDLFDFWVHKTKCFWRGQTRRANAFGTSDFWWGTPMVTWNPPPEHGTHQHPSPGSTGWARSVALVVLTNLFHSKHFDKHYWLRRYPEHFQMARQVLGFYETW